MTLRMLLNIVPLAALAVLAAPAGAAAAGLQETGPAVPPSNGAPAAVLESEYRLALGDKLRIEVYRDQQLSQSLQVRPDGKITMPLLGDLMAAGLTPLELNEQITEGLREYVTNPVVTVILVEATPPVVYVMGEVRSPGTLELRERLTVLQALAMAGGLTEWANGRNITVLRRNPRGVATMRFNYRDAIRGEGAPMYLRPGDTIVVP